MDRRGLLKVIGLGAVAATVMPRLSLPPASTTAARPERRIFVPPRGGWVTTPEGRRLRGAEETALQAMNREHVLFITKDETRFRYLRAVSDGTRVWIERSVLAEPDQWEPANDVGSLSVTYGFDMLTPRVTIGRVPQVTIGSVYLRTG